MNIEVKGINGRLIMKVQENCSFDQFLEDLDQLLDQPLFIQEGYYPRAFFDFGCRVRTIIDVVKSKRANLI